MISLKWKHIGGLNPEIAVIYIFVSKNKVAISLNDSIDESGLRSYKIPQYLIGKQLYLWTTVQNNVIKIFFSGLSRAISANNPTSNNTNKDS